MTTPAGTESCGTACPFCHPAREPIIFENPLVIAPWDAFPVNRGHALTVPRRHVFFTFPHTLYTMMMLYQTRRWVPCRR